MMSGKNVLETLPRSADLRRQLGDALRRVELLRGLLKVAERAEVYRNLDNRAGLAPDGGQISDYAPSA